MKRALILSAALLGGCNDVGAFKGALGVSPFPTSYRAPAVSVAPAKCPPAVAALPTYSPAMQRQVAGEMRVAGNAAWPRMVSDLVYKRQQIRALCK